MRFQQVVVKPELPAGVNPRNVRELEVLAGITDLLAQGRNGGAADAFTQRMIAVRMAIDDNNWPKAACVELTPQDPSSMVPKSLRAMALKRSGRPQEAPGIEYLRSRLDRAKNIAAARGSHPQYWNNLYMKTKCNDGKGKGKGAGKPKKKC